MLDLVSDPVALHRLDEEELVADIGVEVGTADPDLATFGLEGSLDTEKDKLFAQ